MSSISRWYGGSGRTVTPNSIAPRLPGRWERAYRSGLRTVNGLELAHAPRADGEQRHQRHAARGDPQRRGTADRAGHGPYEDEAERLAGERAEPVVGGDAREGGRRDVLLQRSLPERVEDHVPEAGQERSAGDRERGSAEREQHHRPGEGEEQHGPEIERTVLLLALGAPALAVDGA